MPIPQAVLQPENLHFGNRNLGPGGNSFPSPIVLHAQRGARKWPNSGKATKSA